MNKKTPTLKRRLAALTAIGSSFVLLAACEPQNGQTTEEPPPETDDTGTETMPAEPMPEEEQP